MLSFTYAHPWKSFSKDTFLHRMEMGQPFHYVVYISIGYWILNRIDNEKLKWAGLATFLLAIAVMNYKVMKYQNIPGGWYWYTENFLLVLGVTGLLIFLRGMNISSKSFSFLSKYSFGVFCATIYLSE